MYYRRSPGLDHASVVDTGLGADLRGIDTVFTVNDMAMEGIFDIATPVVGRRAVKP